MNWDIYDYGAVAALLIGGGLVYYLAARKFPKPSQRLTLAVIIVLVVMYVWIELAVGVVTNLGN